MGAHVAAAAAAGVLDGGADVGEVHGRGRHRRKAENAERTGAATAAQLREQGEQAHGERAAGQGQPEGLGPLRYGLERVGLVPEAIEKRPCLKDKGHDSQDQVNPGFDKVNEYASVHSPA